MFYSHDLLTVCRELNLEDSIEELMRELGADENGRISYEEFLRRRLALRPEIEALRCDAPQPHGTPDYLPTSSDNSLGKFKLQNFTVTVIIDIICLSLFPVMKYVCLMYFKDKSIVEVKGKFNCDEHKTK